MTTMQDVTGVRPAVIPAQGRVLSHIHLLGIEIEMEGVTNLAPVMRAMTLWASVDDGSLRNNGKEFILANPLSGAQLETAIDQFYHAAGFASSTSWDASHRCGIHIHSDVRDMTTQTYGRLLALSLLLDDYLFEKYNSSNRRGLNFCRAASVDNRTIMLSKRLLTVDGAHDVVIGSADRCKYMSLNLCRVTDLGSIEYRHFNAGLTKEELISLCDDIQHLKKFALLTNAEALQAFKARWPEAKLPVYKLELLGII